MLKIWYQVQDQILLYGSAQVPTHYNRPQYFQSEKRTEMTNVPKHVQMKKKPKPTLRNNAAFK